MSSIPGYTIEEYLAWNWNLIVEDMSETNVSVGMAEALGQISQRRVVLSKEEFSHIVAMHEYLREDMETTLGNFDEENQSWRSYAQCVETHIPECLNKTTLNYIDYIKNKNGVN